MNILNLFLCILLMTSTHSQADSLYRWKDKEGKTHYGDKPAEDSIGAEPRKFGAAPAAGDDELSYGIRKAKQDFPVTLYAAESCGDICVQARALLNKRGVPYTEKNINTNEAIESYKKLTGGTSIPALTVGKSLLRGFEAGQWNSELDVAGYPKIAPFGSRPAPPPSVVKKPEVPVTVAQ